MKNIRIMLLFISLFLIAAFNLSAQPSSPLTLEEIKNGLKNYANDPQKNCNTKEKISNCIINLINLNEVGITFIITEEEEKDLENNYAASDKLIQIIYLKSVKKLIEKENDHFSNCDFLEKDCIEKAFAINDEKLYETFNALPNNQTKLYFTKGFIAYKQKNYKRSVDLLKIAEYENKEDKIVEYDLAKLYELLARNYYLSEDFQMAVNYFEEANNKAKGNFALAYFNLGLIQAQKQKYELAIDSFSKVLKLAKDFVNAYYYRGLVYMNTNPNEATKDFIQVVKLKPKDAFAHFYLGLSNYKSGNYQSAIINFTKVIEQKSDYTEAYYYKGLAQLKNNESLKAINEFTTAIYLKYSSNSIYYYRGLAYLENDYYKLAIDDFTKEIKLNSNNHEAYLNRGIAYLKDKQFQLAINDFSFAINLSPNDANSYFYRGKAQYENENFKLAINDFTDTIKKKEDYKEAYYYRGISRFNQKLLFPIVPDLIIINERTTNYKFFGESYKSIISRNELNLTIQDLEYAIKLEPSYLNAYWYLGITYYHKSNASEKSYFNNPYNLPFGVFNNKQSEIDLTAIEKAVSNFEKVVKTDRNFKPVYKILAECYEILGKLEEAKDCLKKYNELTAKPNQ